MLAELRPTVVIFLLLTLLTGGAYPLVVTLVAQVAFPSQAEGSLIERDGRAVGSSLIGQAFTEPRYFWGRPSAASYNGGASSGSNLGPNNPALAEAVKGRVETLRQADPQAAAPPIDLVTASGSGLDPHISPAAAMYQVPRVALARGIAEPQLRALVDEHTEGRTLGILGEPRVNVLELNLALDAVGGSP